MEICVGRSLVSWVVVFLGGFWLPGYVLLGSGFRVIVMLVIVVGLDDTKRERSLGYIDS